MLEECAFVVPSRDCGERDYEQPSDNDGFIDYVQTQAISFIYNPDCRDTQEINSASTAQNFYIYLHFLQLNTV